ncbi:MAG: hypothetical protein ACO3OO_04305 [Gemmobacter sp.]
MNACIRILLATILLMLPLAPAAAQEPPCIRWQMVPGTSEQTGRLRNFSLPTWQCRERAVRPSEKPVACQLYSKTVDRATGTKICTYRKPGISGDQKTVSVPVGLDCSAQIRC